MNVATIAELVLLMRILDDLPPMKAAFLAKLLTSDKS